jgi:hypothetical protein
VSERRQFVPGVGWVFLLLGCPLVAAGGLWVTAAGGVTADRMLVFLVLAVLASFLFAFSVARLCGYPLRTCAALSAMGAAVSLIGAVVIGLLVVVVVGQSP